MTQIDSIQSVETRNFHLLYTVTRLVSYTKPTNYSNEFTPPTLYISKLSKWPEKEKEEEERAKESRAADLPRLDFR